jgi:hypothetical protein
MKLEIKDLPEESMFFEILPAVRYAEASCPECNTCYKGKLHEEGSKEYEDQEFMAKEVLERIAEFEKVSKKINLRKLGALILQRYMAEKTDKSEITEKNLMDIFGFEKF